MRANQLVHERHLLEAVRRGVIDHGQAEAVLAIARSEPGGAARVPDLAWLGYAQGAVLAIASAGIVVANTDHPWRLSPGDELLRAGAAAAGLLALGLGLRRFRWAEVPASVALAGAAMQLLSVGHALRRSEFEGGERGMALGFGLVLVAGLALWRWLRAGPALGLACLAGSALLLSVLRQQGFPPREIEPTVFFASGALLLAVAVPTNAGRAGARVDGAFWGHASGALLLMVCGAVVIDRSPGAAVGFVALALFVGWLGFALRRRVLLAAAAFSLLTAPAFGLSEAHAGDAAVGAALLLSAAAVGALSHVVRRATLARAADAPPDERSIWI